MTCCGDGYIVKGDGDVLLIWLLMAGVFFKFSLTGALQCSYIFIQFNLKYCKLMLEQEITM